MILLCIAALSVQNIAVISHRGEHLRHPENTMPAFVEAVRVRADFFELDVRTTSDGKLVLMHDADVSRTTNGRGEIAKLTFDQVRALDAGAKMDVAYTGVKVPTFHEALAYAKGKIGIYVDVKDARARDVVEHISANGMTEHVVIYCSPAIAAEIQQLDPRLRVMPDARTVETAHRLVEDLHPRVLAFDAKDFKPEIIAIAKQANALVYVDRLGPFDAPAAWQQAVELGADGIQTDRPEELVRFLKEKGHKRN